MTNNNMEWFRTNKNGIYQLVGYGETDAEIIESGYDVTDGKCRELWSIIKEKFPSANGYKSFCEAYRDGSEEFRQYEERDEKRYKRFWRK